VANVYNNFFIKIAETINIQQVEEGYAIWILKDSFLENFSSIKIIPITEAETKIKHIPTATKKSSDYDEIRSKILKTCASLISHSLIYICNHSLYTGIFPDHLKIVVVKPLYKKGDKTNMANYTTIVLLPDFQRH
jgi:hypothetical protein